MKRQTVYISTLAAILLAAGCQKDGLDSQGNGDGTVRYAVVMDDGMQTKGTQVNTSGSPQALSDFADAVGGVFAARAFEGSGSTPLITQDVEWKTDKWVGNPVAYWPQATSLNFYACANMPSSTTVASAAFSASGLTLNYTSVPEDVTAQKDILLGHYQGNGGNNGTAQIRFEHPLTAIVFKRGTENLPGDVVDVKQIVLSNIASSGTVQLGADGTLSAWNVSYYNGTAILGDGSANLPVDGTTGVIGGTNGVFIIIPQNTASHNITVTITATTLDGPATFSTTISSANLEVGKTNTFTFYPHATRWLEIEYKSPWSSEETF